MRAYFGPPQKPQTLTPKQFAKKKNLLWGEEAKRRVFNLQKRRVYAPTRGLEPLTFRLTAECSAS